MGHAAIYPWHLLQDRQLEVRQRQDGDIFFPAGSLGSKKLKKYFNDIKVPPEQRKSQLLEPAVNRSYGWWEEKLQAGMNRSRAAKHG